MPATEALGAAELSRAERRVSSGQTVATRIDQLSQSDRLATASSLRPRIVRRERTYFSRGQCLTLHWIDRGEELPTWFDETMQAFADLRTLPPMWDSYQAKSIDEYTVDRAMQLLEVILLPHSQAPSIVPVSTGGLQVEWHRGGHDLEIVFEPGAAPEFFHVNDQSAEERTGSATKEVELLKQIIRALE